MIDAYEELEVLCNYYRAEQILAEKILEHSLIQDIEFMQEDWQLDNEIYFQENYSSFMLDYMDYEDDPIYLKVFLHTLPKVEIFIEREYFQNALDFIGIMNGQYSSMKK